MMNTFFSRSNVRIGLASIGLALFLIFVFLLPRNPGPYRAVPSQTSILIEFNGLVKAGQQLRQVRDTTWQAVLKTTIFQNSWAEIGAVERLFHHEAAIRSAFAKNVMLAAWSLHPADSLHPLFILDLGAEPDLGKALETNALELKFFPYQFHGQTLYTVHQSRTDRVVVARKGRLLVFSRYSYLVEDALTQLENPGGWWADNKYLGDLQPGASLRMFFRPSKWEAQHAGSLLKEARAFPAILSANVAWLGLAWDGKKVTSMGESSGFLAGIGAWKGTGCGEIFSVLPDNTAFLTWAGFEDRSLFFRQFAGKEQQHVDFDHFVLPWMGKEAALVVTEPLSAALADDRLLILGVRDSLKAQRALEQYGQTRGLIAQEKVGMFDIFGFQSASLLEPFFSAGDQAFQNPYVVHLGHYVVVAPNRPAIEVFIEKYIASQTLVQNTDFLQLAQRLAPEGRALLALNGGYLPRILQQLFQEPSTPGRWDDDVQKIAGAGWMAATLRPGVGRKLQVNFSAQAQTLQLPVSNVFWKTNLGAPAVTPTFSIAQPGLPMGAVLLVQDKQTTLYCLQPDGAIVWQKHIGNYILSQIKDIDYFQNGRKCYLFNTKTQVWILDETGKDVQGYPLNLKAPARVGATVVDFDKNLKFNYFVCCENGNLYGFDLYGRALEGWNPMADVGKPAGPVLHFQHQGKDYIAMLSAEGVLSVFGRNGKLRFPAVALSGVFGAPPFLDKTGGKPRIVCLNNDGVVYDCDLEGRVHERVWSGRNGTSPIRLTPVNWKGSPAFALLQGQQLSILKFAGNTLQEVYSRRFDYRQDEVFPLETGLGLCARGKRKITLLNDTGKMAKGFPLAGNTPFGICLLGPQKLVAGGNGSAVFAYKLEE